MEVEQIKKSLSKWTQACWMYQMKDQAEVPHHSPIRLCQKNNNGSEQLLKENTCLPPPPQSPVLFLLSFFKKLFVCVMLRLAADSQTRCLGVALLWVMWLKGGDDPHLETGDSGCHGDYLVACTTVTQWPHHYRLRYCLWTLVRKPIKWRRNQCVLFKYSSP